MPEKYSVRSWSLMISAFAILIMINFFLAESSMEVKCDENAMNVVLLLGSKLDYIPESVGLNDASCKPSFQNRTHIVVKCSLDDCGTTSHESEDGKMIVYDNAIHFDVKSKDNIGSSLTRDHQAVFEFQCRFKKRVVLSALHFKASKRVTVTDIGKWIELIWFLTPLDLEWSN